MDLKDPIIHSCHFEGRSQKPTSTNGLGDVPQFLNISPRAPRVSTLEDLQKQQHSLPQSDDEHCSEDNCWPSPLSRKRRILGDMARGL